MSISQPEGFGAGWPFSKPEGSTKTTTPAAPEIISEELVKWIKNLKATQTGALAMEQHITIPEDIKAAAISNKELIETEDGWNSICAKVSKGSWVPGALDRCKGGPGTLPRYGTHLQSLLMEAAGSKLTKPTSKPIA